MIQLTSSDYRVTLPTTLLSLTLFLAPSCAKYEDPHSGHDQGAEPPPAEDDGHETHAENEVELTEEQMQSAGIRVATVAAGEVAEHLSMPAVAAPNADAVTHINPKAPGIVRSIHKHLGERTEAGELLCVIDSVDLGASVSAYVRADALVKAAEKTLEQERELFAQRIETANRVLDGAIEINRQIYAREKDLQEKAVSTMRPLLEADKALKNSELQKDRELTDLRAERAARLLSLEVSVTERRIARDAASNSLRALSVDLEQLAALDADSHLLAGRYEIRAPRSGIVSGRHITTGEFVDAQTKLYTIEDLSQVWILGSAFEQQIQSVRTGQAGLIHLDAFPNQTFEARVTLIGYEVDPESRALGVRLELENPTLPDWPEEFPIRPGMFGRVELVIARSQARVVIPEIAIVHENDGEYVFVQVAPGRFERRSVEHGPASGDAVEILEGLEPGEVIAVAGTFKLKSALRSEELGGGHGH